jgi:hypothetical protein
MLPAEFGEKLKARTNPIRSERHVAHACSHLIKASSLSSKHSKQIHILEEENQEIRNCDVSRARFCDLGEFLYRSTEFNFVTKFKLKVSIFLCCLIFVWTRGVQPVAQTFFV